MGGNDESTNSGATLQGKVEFFTTELVLGIRDQLKPEPLAEGPAPFANLSEEETQSLLRHLETIRAAPKTVPAKSSESAVSASKSEVQVALAQESAGDTSAIAEKQPIPVASPYLTVREMLRTHSEQNLLVGPALEFYVVTFQGPTSQKHELVHTINWSDFASSETPDRLKSKFWNVVVFDGFTPKVQDAGVVVFHQQLRSTLVVLDELCPTASVCVRYGQEKSSIALASTIFPNHVVSVRRPMPVDGVWYQTTLNPHHAIQNIPRQAKTTAEVLDYLAASTTAPVELFKIDCLSFPWVDRDTYESSFPGFLNIPNWKKVFDVHRKANVVLYVCRVPDIALDARFNPAAGEQPSNSGRTTSTERFPSRKIHNKRFRANLSVNSTLSTLCNLACVRRGSWTIQSFGIDRISHVVLLAFKIVVGVDE
jgi:hypothetical protein